MKKQPMSTPTSGFLRPMTILPAISRMCLTSSPVILYPAHGKGSSLPLMYLRVTYFFGSDRCKEMESQQAHKNGLIIAKMNALEDTQIIEKLYAASNAGVKIRLIVRGICSLVPGVEGLSENIEVRSVVGRFLEHSRIFYFNNNGNGRIFLSSADWMTRNFDRRIELLFEITKPEIKSHVQFILDSYLKDTRKTRVLKS